MLFHLSLGFSKLGDAPFDEFAANVGIKMAANAAIFSSPPFTIASFTTAEVAFHNSLAATTQGGTQATLDKNAKRLVVDGLLRQLVTYIQGIPGMTPANAELSGFTVIIAGPHGAVTLVAPVILGITNADSTKLGIKLQGSPGASRYEFRTAIGSAAAVYYPGSFSSTRGIVLENLVPGTTYAVQARAGAGNNQFSAWSDAVSHMCT